MTSIDGYLWTAMLAAALSLRGNYLYVTNITLRRRDGKKKGGKPESLVCELNGNTQTHTSSVWVIARYRTANVQQFSLSGADKCLSEHTIKQPPLLVRNCLIWLRYKCLSPICLLPWILSDSLLGVTAPGDRMRHTITFSKHVDTNTAGNIWDNVSAQLIQAL